MKILLINACVREESRTAALAEYFLSLLDGEIIRVNLNNEEIVPMDRASLRERDELLMKNETENVRFRYALQFREADRIVVAAPYWDLSFPACLKAYFEAVNADGLTFHYTDNPLPETLCKAQKLMYITTAGGPVVSDEPGFGYVKLLAESFYGVKESYCVKAEFLDVYPDRLEEILTVAKKQLDEYAPLFMKE